MKVYITRHGQIMSNVLKKHTNPFEDLTELGIKQAKELSKIIKDINFDIIYVSPYLRAVHTAEILNTNNTKIIIDERLRERNCGKLSGQPVEDNAYRMDYWNYYSIKKHGNAENIKDFFERVFIFLEELKTKNYDKVLIVTHSGVSKAFYGYFNGIPEDGSFFDLGLKNCEMKEYIL